MQKPIIWAFFCLIILFFPVCTSADLSIGADPEHPSIGDQILIWGTTSRNNTIAVYLMVTGPGLDPRGVTLENLNLPAGQGYFSAAHVGPGGLWEYEWNTNYMAGTLHPGTYTVHVVSVPVNMQHLARQDTAAVNITFAAPDDPPPIPLPATAVIGAIMAGCILFVMVNRRRK
jgi:hypothetical protein